MTMEEGSEEEVVDENELKKKTDSRDLLRLMIRMDVVPKILKPDHQISTKIRVCDLY